jgi:hypothetical protein
VTRVDVLPAALTMAGLAAVLRGRPGLSGLAFGLGIAAKLWPILVLPVVLAWLLASRKVRDAAVVGGVAALVALGAHVPFLLLAPEGVWWAYAYQGDRGLQLETVASSMLLVARLLGLMRADVVESHAASDIDSTLSMAVAGALRVVMPLGRVGVAALAWVRLRRLGEISREHQGRVLVVHASAAVAVMLVTSYVLSPQFLIWLVLPVIVAAYPGRRLAAGLVAILALTQVFYPHAYPYLRQLSPALVVVLALRNAALVWLAVALLRAGGRLGDGVAARQP